MSRKTSAYARKQALLANKPKSTLHPLMRFSPENESKLQYEPRMALEFFRCGKGAPEHHTTLVFRLNWGRHMATDLFDNADVVQVIVKAQNAVGGIKSRFDRLDAWGVSAEEFDSIGAGLDLVDEMQLQSTRKELRETADKAMNEIKRANRE